MSTHAIEIARGERFEFGKNWRRFLEVLDDTLIACAEESLKQMLDVETLDGKNFLDIGSGSGLFSLAARRVGARVHSFDDDPNSVACTKELRRRYFDNDPDWRIEEGSALDVDYLKSLGTFNVVYSWGVLHHTGAMWTALDNAQVSVGVDGKLFVAIYNDLGSRSRRWRWIKRTYCDLPRILKTPFALIVIAPEEIRSFLGSLVRLKQHYYLRSCTKYNSTRGM